MPLGVRRPYLQRNMRAGVRADAMRSAVLYAEMPHALSGRPACERTLSGVRDGVRAVFLRDFVRTSVVRVAMPQAPVHLPEMRTAMRAPCVRRLGVSSKSCDGAVCALVYSQ